MRVGFACTGIADLERMLLCLVAAVLSTAELEQSLSEPERTPSVYVDVHPLSMMAAPIAGLAVASTPFFFNVPIAATFAVTERTAITAEVAASVLLTGSSGWTFSASAGPTFYFGSDQPLSGWFVTPKLTFHLGQAAVPAVIFASGNNGPIDFGPRLGSAYLGGLDFGYQWRRDRFHVALVCGFSAGYGYQTLPVITPAFSTLASLKGRQGFVVSGNFDVLRLGFAF